MSKAGAGQSPSLLTPGLPPAGQTAARLAAVLQVCVSYLFIFSMASASSLGPRGVRRLRTLAFEHPGVAHQSRGRGPSVPRPCGLSLRGHRRLCGRRRLDSAPAGVPVDGGVRTSGRRGRPAASPGALPFTLHPSHLIHSNEVSPPSSPPRSPGTPRGSAEADGGDFVRLPGAASSPAGKLSPSPPVHQTHWHTLLLARGTRLVAAWLCKRQVTANREGVSPTRRPRHPSSGPVVAVGTGGSRPPVRARAGGARRAPRASRGAFQRRTREWL